MLRMYTNGHDFAVANSPDEARRLTFQHNTGQDPPEVFSQDQLDDVDGDGWRECVTDRLLTLHMDADLPQDPEVVETRTVKDWVKDTTSPCWFAGEP